MAELTEKHVSAIAQTVREWEIETAVRRGVEELAELQLVLLHYLRGRASIEDVRSELADVHIVLKHYELTFGDYQSELDAKVIKGNPSASIHD